ncbi:MAG: YnbE family lipoprotein [Gammaproteobacteria bacterium]|nr:YnbE family lipoprotein [Gammaproteobacteria bacterium]MBK8993699.1 YnbE family lipoprotein [Gammaproteobacteria bacterium]MBK9467797.1 YnbE family lipoprotein [Gammaproteobacteria bacterium]MBP6481577.1 YnbE family lipoprotein [Pseudomonadales bacterium]MBP7910021.1 YnbE family lipoprotein [Pseudomonadales bacterium]
MHFRHTMLVLLALLAAGACTPTVKVEAPEKPITINLNVKIEHEIRVKVDRELESLFEEDNGLF